MKDNIVRHAGTGRKPYWRKCLFRERSRNNDLQDSLHSSGSIWEEDILMAKTNSKRELVPSDIDPNDYDKTKSFLPPYALSASHSLPGPPLSLSLSLSLSSSVSTYQSIYPSSIFMYSFSLSLSCFFYTLKRRCCRDTSQ
jgi:hypothetical protein